MSENKFHSKFGSEKEKIEQKYIGLTIEIWVGLFLVVSAIPLVNMLALPIAILIFGLIAAFQIVWRYRRNITR